MIISCTLSLLLWQSKLSQKPCGGVHEQVANLKSSVKYLLVNNKCWGTDEQPFNMADLLMNRLSPNLMEQESLASIDVCKTHLVR